MTVGLVGIDHVHDAHPAAVHGMTISARNVAALVDIGHHMHKPGPNRSRCARHTRFSMDLGTAMPVLVTGRTAVLPLPADGLA